MAKRPADDYNPPEKRIELDSDINSIDALGQTALHQAVRAQNLSRVRALLARPNININKKDIYPSPMKMRTMRNSAAENYH